MAQISVVEFEAKVLEKEEIVIKIRASSGTKVDDYVYERKAAGTQSTTEWLDTRIKPLLCGHEVAVIAGNYAAPHGRTMLVKLRDGYEK